MSLPIVSLDPVPEPSDRGAGSAPAAPTVRRHVESFLLDLSVRGVRQGVTLPPGTQAAYVAATPACGAWAVNTLYVRVGAAGGSVPFVVAKAVAAGGGLAVVTVDDAPGLALGALVAAAGGLRRRQGRPDGHAGAPSWRGRGGAASTRLGAKRPAAALRREQAAIVRRLIVQG